MPDEDARPMSVAEPGNRPVAAGGSGPAEGDLLVAVTELRVGYRVAGRTTHWAVDGVTLSIGRGEVLGLIGESGSGKSTLGRALVGMVKAVITGSMAFGPDGPASRSTPAHRADDVAMVFQDSTSSLDPRRAVWRSVIEPLQTRGGIGRVELRRQADEWLAEVGLPSELGSRRPHQLSGGQRQRINIARALVLSPSLVVCDEPTSALDLSAQAGIINLLRRLRERHNIGYLFITHDLAVIRAVADRVAVMYLGTILEIGSADQCIHDPGHPYTAALIAAVPETGKDFVHAVRENLIGDVADPRNVPSGCRFRTRCPFARERCADEVPPLRPLASGHLVACHFAEEIRAARPGPTRRDSAVGPIAVRHTVPTDRPAPTGPGREHLT